MKNSDMTKAEQVIELIATEALSRNEACRRLNYPTSTFEDHIKSEGLSDRYARAREDRAEKIFDEILQIADDGSNDTKQDEDGFATVNYDHIQRSKLRIDARKWMLARMNPKKYGDRMEQVITTGKKLPDWMQEGDE